MSIIIYLYIYITRDSAHNFSFSYNKRKFQTQSHGNLWFHNNMILFFFYGNYLVTTMNFVTMIPYIQKTIFYSFVALISSHLCLISGWAKLLYTLTSSTYHRYRLFIKYMKILHVAFENFSDLLLTYWWIHSILNYYFGNVFISCH